MIRGDYDQTHPQILLNVAKTTQESISFWSHHLYFNKIEGEIGKGKEDKEKRE